MSKDDGVSKITKKKIIIAILIIISFIPIPFVSYLDGGTKIYLALTYKIYDWNKIYSVAPGGEFDKTRVYILGDYFKDYDELWEKEWEKFKDSPERVSYFEATVLEIKEDSVVVEPEEKYDIGKSSDKVEFSTKELSYGSKEEPKVGDKVVVAYRGTVEESYPAKTNAYIWGPEQ